MTMFRHLHLLIFVVVLVDLQVSQDKEWTWIDILMIYI